MAKITPKKKAITKKVEIKSGKETVREVEVENSNKAVQDGVSPKSKLGNKPAEGYATIGISLGATINMGDYQSARVDVFIQRNVKDDEKTIEEEYIKLGDMLRTELERQSAQLDVD